MESDIVKVLEKYDIDTIGIKNLSYKEKKGVWLIETPTQAYVLKKHSNSLKTIKFMIAAVEHLQQRGVLIPQIKRTKNDESIAYIENTCYVLSQAVTGKKPSFKSNDDLVRMVQELAKFHKASTGFQPPSDSKPKLHLGRWKNKYEKQIVKVKEYYEIEKSNTHHNEFGKIILDEFPYFYNRMITAIREHNESDYSRWVKEVGNVGCLCHQDFSAKNLIVDDSDVIYVIDTDSIAMDIPTRDIRKLLNKTMKKRGGWDIDIVKKILNGYQMINPLEEWQWKVLKPTLIYPHLFIGMMSKYYEGRDKKWTEEDYLNRLDKVIRTEKSLDPITGNFQEVIPKQSSKESLV